MLNDTMSAEEDINDLDAFIKKELNKFILKYTGQAALSAIDEIVLSYMVGILESLGSSDVTEDSFDVDQFSEMMSAYIPTFSDINSSCICEWMFQLAGWLKNRGKENGGKNLTLEDFLTCVPQIISRSNLSPIENTQLSSSLSSSGSGSRSRTASHSEDEDKITSHIPRTNFEICQEIDILIEMFPDICIMELQQCLSMTGGDCEKAVQLILQRQDSGQQLNSQMVPGNFQRQGGRRFENVVEDKKLREQILKRYAYIDQDDDAKEHKPVAPKSEPKKLIRYRDNKIVSVKGERFSEVKTEENEEEKKGFVSLKPTRQFRFQ